MSLIKRYPDTGVLTVSVEDDSVNGYSKTETSITGRFESLGKGYDYKARFFIPKLEYEKFELDGQTINIYGKTFEIMQFNPYTDHCELWLD